MEDGAPFVRTIDALPELPVTGVVFDAGPIFAAGCAALSFADDAHHTGYGNAVKTAYLCHCTCIANIEIAVVNHDAEIDVFERPLQTDEIYGHQNRDFGDCTLRILERLIDANGGIIKPSRMTNAADFLPCKLGRALPDLRVEACYTEAICSRV